MGRLIERAAQGAAVLGGLVLCALIALVVASVMGRGLDRIAHAEAVDTWAPALAAWLAGLGVGPIRGDFEIIEAGIVPVILCFLPICQLRGGHASVDLFTRPLGPGANRWLGAVWEAVFAAVLILITWRLMIGTGDKMRNGQTTFLLQIPVWWSFAAASAAAVLASVTALWSAWARLAEAARGEGGT